MIISLKQIAKRAQAGKYAVGAFNTSNLEMTLAIVRAAVSRRSPVIIQTSESAIGYSNVQTLFGIITNVTKTVGRSVPIAIHLDHGKSLGIIQDCIKAGYNSVHIDASLKPLAANIKISRQVAQLAHRHKIAVQAELGTILGKEGMTKLKKGQINMIDIMTKPEQAQEFVAKTGVDTLAVSLGTIHGHFRGIEMVDQARLRKISALVKIPLVLHGGSGLSKAVWQKSIQNGISIINIDTSLRLAWQKALKKSINKRTDKVDPRKILASSTDAMQAEVAKMINIFGSHNQA